ncbi:hypothetical protein ABIB40_000165 [Pedobacter sp. UYP30]
MWFLAFDWATNQGRAYREHSMDVVLKGAYDMLSKMKNSEEGGDDH